MPQFVSSHTLVGAEAGDAPDSREAAVGFSRALGANLRLVRRTREWSLARLSAASRVSRAMLCQIELGRSTPTITVLLRIAQAFDVPLSSLLPDWDPSEPTILRADSVPGGRTGEPSCISRALFPARWRGSEFYEMTLAPGCIERARPAKALTLENLVVAEGAVSVVVAGRTYRLVMGDAAVFPGDCFREYRTDETTSARIFLVRS